LEGIGAEFGGFPRGLFEGNCYGCVDADPQKGIVALLPLLEAGKC
jgi:hypothetical protein